MVEPMAALLVERATHPAGPLSIPCPQKRKPSGPFSFLFITYGERPISSLEELDPLERMESC